MARKRPKPPWRKFPIANVEQLAEAHAIIFGTPTRFGNMAAQMRNFLDQTGGLWAKGALIGKVGSVFASTGTQHGGQETTITSFHTTLLHHGMVIVGVPYSESGLLEHERHHRRHSLRCHHSGWPRWFPPAQRKRTEDCPLPGQARRPKLPPSFSDNWISKIEE